MENSEPTLIVHRFGGLIYVFEDNPSWVNSITKVTIDGVEITEFTEETGGDYVILSDAPFPLPTDLEELLGGKNGVAFNPTLFQSNHEYTIVIKANGYPDVRVTVEGPIIPGPID